MAELLDSGSPRRPLTFIGEDQDRRAQAKSELEFALQSYTKAVSRERELDLQPLSEIWCQYAGTIYDSLAQSYHGLPGNPQALFGESGVMAGGQTRAEVEEDLKRVRVARPEHWPDPEIYRDGDSPKIRRAMRGILVGEDVGFAYLLDEPWFMGQITDCLAERVQHWKDRFAEGRQQPPPRQPVQQHPVLEPNSAIASPPQGTAKGAIRTDRPARPEIEKFAIDAFAVARDRILGEYADKEKSVLAQVRRTHNRGGYLPALIKCQAERVRDIILARADAYVEAFALHRVASDRQAEKDLEAAAKQIAAGSISGIRGRLQLRSVRLRIAEEGQGIPWHLEIERAMHAALAEGKLRLQRQRIKSRQVDGGSTPQPVHAPRQYDAGFWRFLRDEFDVLAARQRSMLVHDTHPKWLKAFCDFSKEHGEFGRCRHQGGLDGRLISDFEEVATRGASALGCPPDMQPVKFWIYRLGQDLLNSPEPTVRKELGPVNAGPHGMEWGWIQGLLESCGGYCSRLAAKAEREAIGGLGDKSQSQPRQKDDEKPGGPREPDLVKPLARMLPVIKVPTRPRLGARLKRLKAESNLPWRTIAKESGISYRWLLEISSGRTPSTGTRTIIRDYFSRVLKRPIHF